MKRLLIFATIVCAAIFTACEKYDDSLLVNRMDNFEQRLKTLEELCTQMNTNISALQAITNALQQNDYVTNIAPINKDGKVIGYSITFSKSGSITLYHGEDGKDGQNGTDGKDGEDGYTPIIGVKKASDGIYYWTLDGEWLLDSDGNKIKAVGTDGKDGEDGADGADGATGPQGPQGPAGSDGEDGEDGATGPQGPAGADGKDGKDGITPQLKIEND